MIASAILIGGYEIFEPRAQRHSEVLFLRHSEPAKGGRRISVPGFFRQRRTSRSFYPPILFGGRPQNDAFEYLKFARAPAPSLVCVRRHIPLKLAVSDLVLYDTKTETTKSTRNPKREADPVVLHGRVPPYFFGESLGCRTFIKNHTEDLFLKLRNGFYAIKSNPPSELELANRLYVPSYVSFEYALAHYRIIPEAVYSVTSATTKITREFKVQGKRYEYSRIKRRAYTGCRLVQEGQTKILIATPEKALIDYCYFVDLKLKSLNDRLRVKKINRKETFCYARLFGRKSLLDLLRGI